MREEKKKMFEHAFIKVGETVVRVSMIKSVYNTVRGDENLCVIKYTDGTETLHRGICADDIWKGLEDYFSDMKELEK